MVTRKQKVEELMADLQSLRRSMVFQMPRSATMPRVTPSQWGVLMLTQQAGSSTVKDLAKALSISSSAATQLVDGLVSSRYLMKKPSTEDRRTTELTLSTKSKTQVEKMKKQALQKFLKLFEVLSDSEFDQYLLLNKKIVEKFSKK